MIGGLSPCYPEPDKPFAGLAGQIQSVLAGGVGNKKRQPKLPFLREMLG
jgi:hypothetical protein